MELSDNYRKLLIKEINFVLKNMVESEHALDKLYYFSGIHGMIHRIMNIEFHSELVYAHFILQTTHETFRQHAMAVRKGELQPDRFSDEHIKKLYEFTTLLMNRIKEKKTVDDVLKKFMLLTYSISGNGYYLLKKGLFEIK